MNKLINKALHVFVLLTPIIVMPQLQAMQKDTSQQQTAATSAAAAAAASATMPSLPSSALAATVPQTAHAPLATLSTLDVSTQNSTASALAPAASPANTAGALVTNPANAAAAKPAESEGISIVNLLEYFNWENYATRLGTIFTSNRRRNNRSTQRKKELTPKERAEYEARVKRLILQHFIDAIDFEDIPVTIKQTKATLEHFIHCDEDNPKLQVLLKFIIEEYFKIDETPRKDPAQLTDDEKKSIEQKAIEKRIKYFTMLKDCLKIDAIQAALKAESVNIATTIDFAIKMCEGNKNISIREFINLEKIANIFDCDLGKYFKVTQLENIVDQVLRKEELSRYHVLDTIKFRPLIEWFARQALEEGKELDCSEDYIEKMSESFYAGIWFLSELISNFDKVPDLFFRGLYLVALEERRIYPELDYVNSADARERRLVELREKVKAAEEALEADRKKDATLAALQLNEQELAIMRSKRKQLEQALKTAHTALAAEYVAQKAAEEALKAEQIKDSEVAIQQLNEQERAFMRSKRTQLESTAEAAKAELAAEEKAQKAAALRYNAYIAAREFAGLEKQRKEAEEKAQKEAQAAIEKAKQALLSTSATSSSTQAASVTESSSAAARAAEAAAAVCTPATTSVSSTAAAAAAACSPATQTASSTAVTTSASVVAPASVQANQSPAQVAQAAQPATPVIPAVSAQQPSADQQANIQAQFAQFAASNPQVMAQFFAMMQQSQQAQAGATQATAALAAQTIAPAAQNSTVTASANAAAQISNIEQVD